MSEAKEFLTAKPEVLLRHNKSAGLSQGVSWVLYPTGQGYNL